ncbi:FixH family protein [Fibrella sp. HMF5335]|uniref:FixH family protein n=1 Tax=Fibrella rubiginis TaxID=2817060 RepID=A0A939GEP2_9BACT|nr:FixH family protein [Fibrella rubiginis]MBO0935430.1 FixH family protein [Fibrella rubiginis]
MSWGKAIILIFILFAGFIGTLVYLMHRERIDLVRDDYYQDEIAYQRQINRVVNARHIDVTTIIQYVPTRHEIRLNLPDSLRHGTFLLYRPADRRHDVRLALTATTPTVSTIAMQEKPGGLWRAQLTWSNGQRDFYTDRELTLP